MQFQQQLKTLHEISNELTKVPNLDELCRRAIELGHNRLGFDRLGIWFFDEHDPTYTIGTYGIDAHGHIRDERHLRVPFAQVPMIEEALRTGQIIHTRENIQIIEPTGTRTGWNVIAVLSDSDKHLGWLSADNYLSSKPLTTYQVELLEMYGLTIGHLCTRFRVEETLRQREAEARLFQEQLKVLNEISIELSMTSTLDALCQMAVERGRDRLGFDRLGIWFYHPETRRMHGSFGTDKTGQTVDERASSWQVADENEYDPIQINQLLSGKLPISVYQEVPLTDAKRHMLGQGWRVVAPLHDGQKIIGTLAVDNLLKHKPLIPYQIELIQLYSLTVGQLCLQKRAEQEMIELRAEGERMRILAEFIRDASHEFRTPLSIIYTKLYLLEKNPVPDRIPEHLRVIQDQTDTIFRLVESLVLLSQLDSGIDFRFTSVNLKQLVQGIIAQMRQAHPTKDVTLELDAADDVPPVWADVEKLYRALHNLIGNAVRFTPQGVIKITIRADGEQMVSIRIQDPGVGINELDLPHIFKRFYRVDKAHTTRGLGLGLPISRKIIEQHGGTITAESQLDVGTTITVSLPAR